MSILKKISPALLSTLILTSCATIMHGTRQTVGIASNPSDAAVWVDEVYVGNSPVIVSMKRNRNHVIRIELEGFQPYEAVFTKQLSAWVFGNVVFGGVIGLAVDAISGGIYKLTPDQIQAELHHQSYYSQKSDDSFITVVLNPDPAWEKIGNLTSSL